MHLEALPGGLPGSTHKISQGYLYHLRGEQHRHMLQHFISNSSKTSQGNMFQHV